ncbi:MAG: hypothetical protein ACLUW6_03105 [Coriobacteriaceae bacterium]
MPAGLGGGAVLRAVPLVAVTAYHPPAYSCPVRLAVVLKSCTIDLDQPRMPARAPAHLPPRAVHHLARPCR